MTLTLKSKTVRFDLSDIRNIFFFIELYFYLILGDSHEVTIKLQVDALKEGTISNLNTFKTNWKIQNIRTKNIHREMLARSECGIQLTPGEISNIEVCQVPEDGSCLFGAAVHQHFLSAIGSDEYNQNVLNLRKNVVDHIRSNPDQYKHDILNRILELGSDHKKISEIENVEEECEKYLNRLSLNGSWGGSESAKAISEIFKANLVIFNEYGTVYFLNSFNSSFENVITLAFRIIKGLEKENVSNEQRNHYDSVINITDDIVEKSSLILMEHMSVNSSIGNISIITLD